jgi:hypothetical protein
MSKEKPGNNGQAPAITPPGRVIKKNTHGPGERVVVLSPIERLRAALQMSEETTDQAVILEAAIRAERRELPAVK